MTRVRSRLAPAALALLLCGAVFATATLQLFLADRRATDVSRLDELRTAMARADALLLARSLGQATPGALPAILAVRDGGVRTEAALGEIGDWSTADAQARELRRRLATWSREITALLIARPAAGTAAVSMRTHAATSAAIDRLLTDVRAHITRDGSRDQRSLTRWMLLSTLVLVSLAGGAVSIALGRRRRTAAVQVARESAHHTGVEEFAAAMQLVEGEEEAHWLIRHHLERTLETADAVVLNRNNSHNRLEATTTVPPDLKAVFEIGVEPRACLAVRAGQPHVRSTEHTPLVSCAVCGARDRDSTCQPLLVSGEVIGSVLVGHPAPLDDLDRRTVDDAVARAAPVLGNLRTLAIAETRAATDALTGLPNRRALQDTLKRMVAQSQRSLAPLTALALDLDHFKQINDRFGHEKGDEVLAAVGQVLTDGTRESDFAARVGGEEFVILLPGTDVEGGRLLAAKLCQAVARIEVAGIERKITASIGIAAHPDHAFDAPTLLRKADRALYAAKEAGRDRVEVAADPAPSREPEPEPEPETA